MAYTKLVNLTEKELAEIRKRALPTKVPSKMKLSPDTIHFLINLIEDCLDSCQPEELPHLNELKVFVESIHPNVKWEERFPPNFTE
jgi:hypothetical protein